MENGRRRLAIGPRRIGRDARNMSASNYNWVCFECRNTIRQAKTSRRIPRCPDCGADCYCLGYKVEIPRKSDARGWRRLHLDCRQRELAWSEQQAVKRVRDAHATERRIADLHSRGANRDRDKLLAELKQKLRA